MYPYPFWLKRPAASSFPSPKPPQTSRASPKMADSKPVGYRKGDCRARALATGFFQDGCFQDGTSKQPSFSKQTEPASRKRGLETDERDAEQYAAEEAADHDSQAAGESQALGTCKFCGSFSQTPKGCESCIKHWADEAVKGSDDEVQYMEQARGKDWAAGAWTKPDTDSEDEDNWIVVTRSALAKADLRALIVAENPPKQDEPNIKAEPKQKEDEDKKVLGRLDRRQYRVPGTPVQHDEIKATLLAIKAEQDASQAMDDDESQVPDF